MAIEKMIRFWFVDIDSPHVSDDLQQFLKFDLFDLDDLFLTFILVHPQLFE